VPSNYPADSIAGTVFRITAEELAAADATKSPTTSVSKRCWRREPKHGSTLRP